MTKVTVHQIGKEADAGLVFDNVDEINLSNPGSYGPGPAEFENGDAVRRLLINPAAVTAVLVERDA